MIESVHQAINDPGAAQSGVRELQRVESEIGRRILDFCRERLFDTFRMEELTSYVRARVAIAPDSAGRILRKLRKDGVITVELVSRRESLYCVTRIEEEA